MLSLNFGVEAVYVAGGTGRMRTWRDRSRAGATPRTVNPAPIHNYCQ